MNYALRFALGLTCKTSHGIRADPLVCHKMQRDEVGKLQLHPEANSDPNSVIRHLRTEKRNWQCLACPMTFACENFQWAEECLLGGTNATQIKLNIANGRALMPNQAEAAAALGKRLL